MSCEGGGSTGRSLHAGRPGGTRVDPHRNPAIHPIDGSAHDRRTHASTVLAFKTYICTHPLRGEGHGEGGREGGEGEQAQHAHPFTRCRICERVRVYM